MDTKLRDALKNVAEKARESGLVSVDLPEEEVICIAMELEQALCEAIKGICEDISKNIDAEENTERAKAVKLLIDCVIDIRKELWGEQSIIIR